MVVWFRVRVYHVQEVVAILMRPQWPCMEATLVTLAYVRTSYGSPLSYLNLSQLISLILVGIRHVFFLCSLMQPSPIHFFASVG